MLHYHCNNKQPTVNSKHVSLCTNLNKIKNHRLLDKVNIWHSSLNGEKINYCIADILNLILKWISYLSWEYLQGLLPVFFLK